ncbi:hypothetical protein HanRHA438_Chr17g0811001 [Helianthus annuus]|nr:hypothetical protein HanRHA438_Chr17g0811001 [Helianthus annuus]
MFRLIPKILALIAVQRQTAASRSASPLRSVQHGVFGGFPTTRWIRSLSKLAHTPNLSVSFGQVALGGEGVGVFGGEGVGGDGVGVLGGEGESLVVKVWSGLVMESMAAAVVVGSLSGYGGRLPK